MKAVIGCTFYVTVEVPDDAGKIEIHRAVEERLNSTPSPAQLHEIGELEIDKGWEILE